MPPGVGNSAADSLSLAFDGDDFRLYISAHIIRNLTRVLSELTPSDRLIEGFVEAVLKLVTASGGEVIEPPRKCVDIEDYEDNLIVDLALACDATLIVSDDTDLTGVSPWNGSNAGRPATHVRRTQGAGSAHPAPEEIGASGPPDRVPAESCQENNGLVTGAPLHNRYIVQERKLFAVAANAKCDCRTLLVQGRGPVASLCDGPSIR